MRVLHHDRAVRGLHLLHLRIQRLLGHVLNVGVHRQHQVLARLRLLHIAFHHVVLGIHVDEHMPRHAMHVRIELLLQAAQPAIIRAPHSPATCARQVRVRVEALELLGRVDALEVQLLHTLGSLRIHLARHPRKVARGIQPPQDLPFLREVVQRVRMHDARQQCRVAGPVLAQLARHREHAVHGNRHGQLAQIAVIEHTAPRGHFKAALLLLRRQVDVVIVPPHLQPRQLEPNGQRPQAKKQRHPAKARPANRSGQRLAGGGLHGSELGSG